MSPLINYGDNASHSSFYYLGNSTMRSQHIECSAVFNVFSCCVYLKTFKARSSKTTACHTR